jgi:hypothetical protein
VFKLFVWQFEPPLALAHASYEADCLLSPVVALVSKRADLALAVGVAFRDVAREALYLGVAILGVVREALDLAELLLGRPAEVFKLFVGQFEPPLALAYASDEADCLLSPVVALVSKRADLALALGKCLLGSREPRPLFLQLPEKERLGRAIHLGLVALDGTRIVFRLCRRRLHDAERGRAGDPTIVLVPSLDLSAKTRPESGLHRQLDAVLRRQRARKIGARHEAELDDRLAEPLTCRLLQNEGALELVVGQKTLFDEQAPKGTPRNAGRFHTLDIGVGALGDKRFLTRCLFRVRSYG